MHFWKSWHVLLRKNFKWNCSVIGTSSNDWISQTGTINRKWRKLCHSNTDFKSIQWIWWDLDGWPYLDNGKCPCSVDSRWMRLNRFHTVSGIMEWPPSQGSWLLRAVRMASRVMFLSTTCTCSRHRIHVLESGRRHYWAIIKDTTQEQPYGRDARGRCGEGPGLHAPSSVPPFQHLHVVTGREALTLFVWKQILF